MLKFLQNSLLAKSILVGSLLLAPTAAIASEAEAETQLNSEVSSLESIDAATDIVDLESDELGQVTSVSQLRDVFPTDWAFQAVQSLVERYGCIAGYPDGTFRGNQKATRYEMAAALNACLDQISDRFASKADIDMVKALQAEFAAELATLRGRVDGLEARVATVEAQQFSTTTKLKGEVVFGTGFVFDEDGPLADVDGTSVPPFTDDGNVGDDRVFFGYRARLNFDTSFTGSDRLRVRLEAADIPELDEGGAAGTSKARLGFDENDPEGAQVILDELHYRFKPTEDVTLKVAVVGGDYKDDVNTFNPYLKSSGDGALSRFFRINPTVYRAPGGTTLSAVWEASDQLAFSFVYAADDAFSPVEDADENGGIFGAGQFGLFAQVGFNPTDKIGIGLSYARNQFRGGADITQDTGDAPTTIGGDTSDPFNGLDTNTDNFGIAINADITKGFAFSGWAGLTLARSPELVDSEIQLINWAANFIFPDLFAEGNRGSLSVGMQPFISDSGDLLIDDGPNPNITAEAQYQFKVSKNIKISPGVIMVFRANNTEANDPIFIPVIRTTFKF